LEVLKQFQGMKTGQTIVDTQAFAASLSGTYPLNTTEFIPSNKVDVDTALLKKVQSEDVKAEMKRTKEAKEAKKNEAFHGVQKQIEEANLLGRELKEASD
jgi:hypothetical protein